MNKLGYCCINLTLREKDIFTSRTCRQNTFSLEKVNELALQNVIDLYQILNWNISNNITFFRVGSEIFPFMDHETLGYSIDDLKDGNKIKDYLALCGKYSIHNDIRLECHPGPYCLLGSPNPKVNENGIRCLTMHSLIGDLLNYETVVNGYQRMFNINFHVGGPYGNKKETAIRFKDNFNKLPLNIQKRITIENDDKLSGWSVKDLWELISQETKIPICFDAFHHTFNTGEMSQSEALTLCKYSWENSLAGKQKMSCHYSEAAIGKKPTAHADFIENKISLDSDVMLDAKAKELALLKYLQICNGKN